MTRSLTLHPELLFQAGPVQYGIAADTLERIESVAQQAVQTVEARLQANEYGFVSELENDVALEKIQQIHEQIRWAETLVVIGIGGSDLGARALQQALESENPPQRVLFHGDSTDPVALDRLLLHLDIRTTVFNIISKSGETVETISQYVYLKQLVQQVTNDWQKHFVFTTDAERGILREEADEHGVQTLAIPDAVGGRFSVLTSVGLLPALSMGIDIRALTAGARNFARDLAQRNLAYSLAKYQFALAQQNTPVIVCMPYSVQLEEFARWFRQLWAESIGKDGKGTLPVQARGPADQHSQVQFYAQGTPLQALLFIRVEQRDNPREITECTLGSVQYLQGHTFHEILNAEQTATALALAKSGRPSMTLSVQRLTPESMGALIVLFELAVVCLAQMLGVNAFDQPGVEEGKQMMYALLGREGYESVCQEVSELQKQLTAQMQETAAQHAVGS